METNEGPVLYETEWSQLLMDNNTNEEGIWQESLTTGSI